MVLMMKFKRPSRRACQETRIRPRSAANPGGGPIPSPSPKRQESVGKPAKVDTEDPKDSKALPNDDDDAPKLTA